MIRAISLILGLTTFIFLAVVFADLSARENPHGDIGWDCDVCHTPEGWEYIKESSAFSHSETGFPLTGAHKDAGCRSCHKELQFAHIGIECADCHTDVHRAQFGIECRNCHTPIDWQDRKDILDTHAERGFPLVGVHVIVDCDACHIAQGREEFVGTPIECEGCHIDNFSETVDPDHSLANFSLDCQECHAAISSSWNQAIFQHPEQFALRGAHTLINCGGCHSETFAGTPQLCFECHENDYNSVPVPSHVTLGFPTECETCHNEVAWTRATFDHVQASGFGLVGIHSTLSCVDCHVDNQYDLPRECIGCHQSDYDAVADPDHIAAGFPEDCTQCHNQNGWSPVTFDHNLTSFPLTGQHLSIDCSGCHVNGQFAGTPADCWSCHQDNYNGVNDPDHAGNNFSQDCTLCHTTSGWTPSTFNHAQTQFPLTGAHTSLNCVECHADGYSGTPSDCWSCHQDDYIGADDPDHVANNFSHDCTECHTTDGWDTDEFNHSQTQFPITGAHTLLNCVDCHANGYSGTPGDCWSCHENDYNNVADPNHVENNFSQDCTQCHSASGWTPVSFDHSQTQFPLTGAHLVLACIACHSSGYNNTPTPCFACHEDDYGNTADPDHAAAGFPTNCEQCHNTSGWEQTTWDHDNLYFPIYSGRHQGEWNICADCHVNPNNYEVFECIFCHEHSQPDMDEEHIGVPGYVYESTACYSCHPDGE